MSVPFGFMLGQLEISNLTAVFLLIVALMFIGSFLLILFYFVFRFVGA